jgi:hypothetical protein
MCGRDYQSSRDRKWTEQGTRVIHEALCLARFPISKTQLAEQKPHRCEVQLNGTQVIKGLLGPTSLLTPAIPNSFRKHSFKLKLEAYSRHTFR